MNTLHWAGPTETIQLPPSREFQGLSALSLSTNGIWQPLAGLLTPKSPFAIFTSFVLQGAFKDRHELPPSIQNSPFGNICKAELIGPSRILVPQRQQSPGIHVPACFHPKLTASAQEKAGPDFKKMEEASFPTYLVGLLWSSSVNFWWLRHWPPTPSTFQHLGWEDKQRLTIPYVYIHEGSKSS